MSVKISVILLLAASTQQINLWFSVQRTGNALISGATLAGNNEEYLVHGSYEKLGAHQINYQTGSSASPVDSNFEGAIVSGGNIWFITPYTASKVLLAHKHLMVYDFLSSTVDHIFAVPSAGQNEHYLPIRIPNTDYFLSTTYAWNSGKPTNPFAYRLQPSNPSSIQKITLEHGSRSGG